MKKLFIFIFSISTLFSSEQDVDFLLNVGKQKAYNNEYEVAITIFNTVINEAPKYYDAYMLKARVFAWDQKYQKSFKLTANRKRFVP